MNGIEKITARLEADAQAEIDALNAETDAVCDQIREEYEAKALEAYTKRKAKGEADCAARVERLSATADMETRKSVLAFKQEMVSEAFEKAVQSIIDMPKADYVEFLAAQAAKAALYGTEELVLNERDRKAVGHDVEKRANVLARERGLHGGLTLSEETADIRGGLLLRQGNIEVNCAVETLMGLYRSSLATQVANILFA